MGDTVPSNSVAPVPSEEPAAAVPEPAAAVEAAGAEGGAPVVDAAEAAPEAALVKGGPVEAANDAVLMKEPVDPEVAREQWEKDQQDRLVAEVGDGKEKDSGGRRGSTTAWDQRQAPPGNRRKSISEMVDDVEVPNPETETMVAYVEPPKEKKSGCVVS